MNTSIKPWNISPPLGWKSDTGLEKWYWVGKVVLGWKSGTHSPRALELLYLMYQAHRLLFFILDLIYQGY